MTIPRIAATLLLPALVACGQKGPLYLPDTTQGEVVTRPAPMPAETSNSPATPDSPSRSAPPAPEVTAPEVSAPETPAPAGEDAQSAEKKKQNGNPPPK